MVSRNAVVTGHGDHRVVIWTRRRSDSSLRAVAQISALASAGILVVAALRSDGWPLSWLGFSLVGAVILRSRPRNTTGWLLLATGLAMSTALITVAAGSIGTNRLLEWFDWISFTVPILIGLLLLTFPGGSIPSPRWRVALVLGWAATAGLVIVMALAKPELIVETDLVIDNPVHVPELAGLARAEPVFTGVVAGLIALVVVNLVLRFRHSQGQERQQFRWLAFAAAVAPLLLLFGSNSPSNLVTVIAFVLALNLIPSAIGVAVLRYRLYEIDRLISRTVSYAAVIGVLAGMFLVIVSTLGSLTPTDSPLAVAGSTLLVAALFNPLRHRVLERVDRWFNRTRYEAQRVVDDFAASIRDETEIDRLTEGLGTLVTTTFRPTVVGIWITEDS